MCNLGEKEAGGDGRELRECVDGAEADFVIQWQGSREDVTSADK